MRAGTGSCVTPLSTRSYFRIKLLTAYSTAVGTIACSHRRGRARRAARGRPLGGDDGAPAARPRAVRRTRNPARTLLSADSIGPAIGGTTALLGLLGGVWFPITGGALHVIAQTLPSYWLVQAAHVGLGGDGWG